MSDTYPYQWTHQDDAFVLVIPDTAEALVAPHDGVFQAAVYDYRTQRVVWEGERFPTMRGAKIASRVALKRLGYFGTAVAFVDVAADQLEAEPIEVAAVERGVPQSIWKPVTLRTTVVGKGIEVICTIEVREDCVEATTTLGSFVFREEYPDEWSAKRGAHQWATTLIERHA